MRVGDMAVSVDVVRSVSKLACINVLEEEIEAVTKDLNAILHWVEQLNEVDVTNSEPMKITSHTLPERADEIQQAPGVESILANAPDSVDSWFAVPKIVCS
jgi:aspartyl-tRNA(Asn)/glutamyl-tRNA(Gln) amidotransferase subunit C